MRESKRKLELEWSQNYRNGKKHHEWTAPCGCAYHPSSDADLGKGPHIHPCKEHQESSQARADLATERERELVEALEVAEPVYATANNTNSVRSGHEMSGYVKHYKIPPHVLHKALRLDKLKEQSNVVMDDYNCEPLTVERLRQSASKTKMDECPAAWQKGIQEWAANEIERLRGRERELVESLEDALILIKSVAGYSDQPLFQKEAMRQVTQIEGVFTEHKERSDE